MKTLNHRRSERGAVLIVALLFLVILTMLGVTAMTGSTMEQRMAGNTRDIGVALQAAEAALRDARRDINSMVISGSGRSPTIHVSQFGDGSGLDNGTCSATAKGLCRPSAHSREFGQPLSPTLNIDAQPYAQYGEFTGAPQIPGVANQPRYLIEVFCIKHLGIAAGGPPCKFYRITARGYGGNPNSQVTLQEIFEVL